MMKMLKKFGIGALVLLTLLGVFSGGAVVGFRIGEKNPENILVRGVTNLNHASDTIDFGVFWQAWDLVNENYLKNDEVSNQEKVRGAIAGLVRSLGDPHSTFFSPTESEQFSQDVDGNFGGIGAEIGLREDQIVVVAPLAGTPASRAGLQPQDAILSVNSTSTEGLSVDQAVRMIRGPKGTMVTLSIFRNGWKAPKDFALVRETILAPTVDFEMKGSDVAYVALHSFNLNANQAFHDAIMKAVTRGARGLILDLRNDPGGYLDVAVQLGGWFVPRGTLIVSEATRAGVADELRAQGNAALATFPVVVLVNGGSASAAEILAGMLRDVRHAPLIGETTFGKGTVQQVMDLRDGSTVKLTIAHWVLPSGKILDHDGLVPDYVVKLSDADIESKNDTQLTKALEVIHQEIIAADK